MLLISTVVLLIAVLFFVSLYNKGITLKNYVNEAFSTMDVYMKKRWDLIPNLIEITKGYMEHEKEVFYEVTKLRNLNYSSMSEDEKMDVNNKLSLGLSKLIAVSENYPEIKSSENFKQMSLQLANIEGDIAKSRKYYNGCVREYNTYIAILPSCLIAGMCNWTPYKFFEIDGEQRENIQIKF